MFHKRLWTPLLLILASPATYSQPCPDNSRFSDFKALIHKTAIIGTDDRVVRDGKNGDLEAAQGRIYCLEKHSFDDTPAKKKIVTQRHVVSNATLAFDADMVLVARHMFFNDSGKQDQKITNCFFEHIASGEIIPIVDWEWPPMPKNLLDTGHQDYALLRLKRPPSGGRPVPKQNIIIYREKEISKPITVVSNYARNLNDKEALTITSCHRKGFYRLTSNAISNLWGTDCDTGMGPSGAQVYIEQDGKQKLFALVSRELTLTPDGGNFDPKNLATKITQFDESLFEAYERLKQRSSI